jgi:hypothetical protein
MHGNEGESSMRGSLHLLSSDKTREGHCHAYSSKKAEVAVKVHIWEVMKTIPLGDGSFIRHASRDKGGMQERIQRPWTISPVYALCAHVNHRIMVRGKFR